MKSISGSALPVARSSQTGLGTPSRIQLGRAAAVAGRTATAQSNAVFWSQNTLTGPCPNPPPNYSIYSPSPCEAHRAVGSSSELGPKTASVLSQWIVPYVESFCEGIPWNRDLNVSLCPRSRNYSAEYHPHIPVLCRQVSEAENYCSHSYHTSQFTKNLMLQSNF